MRANLVHRKNLLVFLLVSQPAYWYPAVRREAFPDAADGYEVPERKTRRGA